MGSNKKHALIPIFVTAFIDLLGYGLVIPILAPLLLNDNSRIFPAGYPHNLKTIMLGIIINLNVNMPILGSAIFTFAGWLIFYKFYNESKAEKFKEV